MVSVLGIRNASATMGMIAVWIHVGLNATKGLFIRIEGFKNYSEWMSVQGFSLHFDEFSDDIFYCNSMNGIQNYLK